jgi:hypothetical protein
MNLNLKPYPRLFAILEMSLSNTLLIESPPSVTLSSSTGPENAPAPGVPGPGRLGSVKPEGLLEEGVDNAPSTEVNPTHAQTTGFIHPIHNSASFA